MKKPLPTSAQVRAARELLRWDQKTLAESTGLGIATIRRFEGGDTVRDGSVTLIERVLIEAGVKFLAGIRIDGVLTTGVVLTSDAEPLARRKRTASDAAPATVDARTKHAPKAAKKKPKAPPRA